MWHNKIRRLISATCVAVLLISNNADASPFGGLRAGNIGDLLTPIVIGAILGGARHRLKAQKEQDGANQQPLPSAQHHHPYYTPLPWYPNPFQQHPLLQAQASFMLPAIHHEEMIHPQAPFYPDMSSLLLQLNREQAYPPMASHMAPTIFDRNALQGLNGMDFPALESLQSWQRGPNVNLPNNPMDLADLLDSIDNIGNQQ
ncbi:uncharacterized protein [Parasteatoda tepidariorum]|nr:uncharacterized protein LOC107436934 isoform X2 [Parasteatoda tepidariorum]XP_042905678.1 uncharacterized protein LOC107436934 isoform X2 [Parasteatoda tepidariorum]XP_042905682.1 uncharacterized protein LOC107436934 isoform X2 [Parasteatoda tepidariorum]